MTNYDLTKDVAKSFTFNIGDHRYTMRYPAGPERKQMSKLGLETNRLIKKAEQAQEADNQEDSDRYAKEAEKPAQEFSKLINSLITPEGEAPKDLDKLLDEQPNPVLWNFQKLLEAQLSVQAPNQAQLKQLG